MLTKKPAFLIGVIIAAFFISAVSFSISNQNIAALWHLNEGVGYNIYDETGINFGSLSQDGVSWVNGTFGSALEFDGVSGYVKVYDNSNALDFNWTNFTISAWIKTSDVQGIIVNKGIDKPGNLSHTAYHTYVDSSGRFSAMLHSSGGDKRVSGSVVNDNKWHQVVTVFDFTEETMSLYVDGIFDKKGSFAGRITEPPVNDRPLYIGNIDPSWSGAWHYTGMIDEVMILNKALIEDEVKSLYDAGEYNY